MPSNSCGCGGCCCCGGHGGGRDSNKCTIKSSSRAEGGDTKEKKQTNERPTSGHLLTRYSADFGALSGWFGRIRYDLASQPANKYVAMILRMKMSFIDSTTREFSCATLGEEEGKKAGQSKFLLSLFACLLANWKNKQTNKCWDHLSSHSPAMKHTTTKQLDD